jgi:uncharacterized membrane protein
LYEIIITTTPHPFVPKKGKAVMLKSLSTSLVLRGLLALGIGVVALAWPGVTVLALVVLFAVYAFIAAGLQAGTCCSGWSTSPPASSPWPGRGRPPWSSC